METEELDGIDKKLIFLLAQDGRFNAKELAAEIGVSPPTITSRIKRLVETGVMKIAGLIDVFRIKSVITAIVAINVADDSRHTDIINKLGELSQVIWASSVTGRYDIFVEVILMGDMQELYKFNTEVLPKLGGIRSSESFVVMKSKRRWTLLPPNVNNWLDMDFTDRKEGN